MAESKENLKEKRSIVEEKKWKDIVTRRKKKGKRMRVGKKKYERKEKSRGSKER